MPQFEATCAKGLEYLLKDELVALGATRTQEKLSRVVFEADWQVLYRSLMWSRVASRVLFPISQFTAEDDEALYKHAAIIDWLQHIKPGSTFMVTAQTYRSTLNHSRFIAQRIKDAIVDYFEDMGEIRPNVDLNEPEVAFHCRIRRNQVTLSVDLAGQGLHRRGYRTSGGAAPVKENLAAALLYRAGWCSPDEGVLGMNHQSDHQKALFDPMAGSGTFLIEGAMMAFDIAPGLYRPYLTLTGWRQFQQGLWESVKTEAFARSEKGRQREVSISGQDINPRAVAIAQANIEQAGLADKVSVRITALDQIDQLAFPEKGTFIVNPPYSERLGEQKQVESLYRELGEQLRKNFIGWQGAVLCPQKTFGHQLGIRAQKRYQFNNGSIPCQLLCLDIRPEHFVTLRSADSVDKQYQTRLSTHGIQLLNRLKKNHKRLQSFLTQNAISCYRLYDADLPDFNAAVDVYRDVRGETWACLQEYKPPAAIEQKKAQKRLIEMQHTLAGFLQIPPAQVFVKQRVRDKGGKQYAQGMTQEPVEVTVEEFGRLFLLRLNERIDTGLFIDHRKLRRRIGNESSGKRMLNLFCYTASASVYAASSGAMTTNVDLSNTYLQWAQDNFRLNHLEPASHQFIRADCMHWLEQAVEANEKFDLVFVDPPTFSNSKKTNQDFDVQKHHAAILDACCKMLNPGGTIYFSNNFRQFQMQWEPAPEFRMQEITRQTTSSDFARKPLHRCWQIRQNHPE